MEKTTEGEQIIKLYDKAINFLRGQNEEDSNPILKELESIINTESFWTDILKLFLRKTKSLPPIIKKNILEDAIKDNKLNYASFLQSCILNLVEYYCKFSQYFENKEKLIKYYKENNLSIFQIFLLFCLGDDDGLENYKQIDINVVQANEYCETYIKFYFNLFCKYCINYIEKKEIDQNINYIMNLFTFLSDTRYETSEDILYKYISKLFFEIKSNNVVSILEEKLREYKQNEIIKTNICIFLDKENQGIESKECEYLKFITLLNVKINPKSNDFLIKFFKYLDKDELINFFNKNENIGKEYLTKIIEIKEVFDESKINETKNEDRDKINNEELKKKDMLINDVQKDNSDRINIIKEEQIKINIQKEETESIDSVKTKKQSNNIQILKEGLQKYTIRQYFNDQIKKYSEKFKNKSKFNLNELITKKKYSKVLKYKINQKYFPIVGKIFFTLTNMLEKLNKEYRKDIFGFVMINEEEYFYMFHNEKIYEDFLFNSNNIKKNAYSEIGKDDKAMNIIDTSNESCSKSIKSMINNGRSIKRNLSFHSISIGSKKSNNSYRTEISEEQKSNESYQNGYDIPYFKGQEFENNANHFFQNMFNLEILPNYFFPLVPNNHTYSEKVTFSQFNEAIFSRFLETDGAYINKKDKKIWPVLNRDFRPYFNHNTFFVKEDNKNSYRVEFLQEELSIHEKSIIIIESKLSIPKEIKDFSFTKEYSRNDLDRTLLFTLNKLIKKISFYSEYVKYEKLGESEKIDNYTFQLFLIYNNIPINDLETKIKESLDILIKEKFIKKTFILNILYLIPNLGSYNINSIKNELTDLKDKYNNLENKYNDLKSSNKELKDNYKELKDNYKELNEKFEKLLRSHNLV